MDKLKASKGIQRTNMKVKRKAQNKKILPKSSALREIRQDPIEHFSTDLPRMVKMAKMEKVNKRANKENIQNSGNIPKTAGDTINTKVQKNQEKERNPD